MKKHIIAIDGYSSCGKSTLAKALAKTLHYAYVDTGAMYRAAALYFLQNDVDMSDETAVQAALQHIEIHFERTPTGNHVFLNGEDVESQIRLMTVSEKVSEVAALSDVRRYLVEQQQKMGKRKNIVMDGRDIGTVVFPTAELKIFLTADEDIRTQRRFEELTAKGENVAFETIKANLLKRDFIDSTRSDSPLRQAKDAILIDNSYLTPAEQLQKVLDVLATL